MTERPAVPVPVGFNIVLDSTTKVLRQGRLVVGGSPRRALRFSPAGARAFAELRTGPVTTPEGGVLARRLLRAGLAHPRPPVPEHPLRLVTIVPVRDRVAELDRCLHALGREHPVVVVDDASRESAAVAAMTRRHGARLVTRSANGGPSAARNTGLASIDRSQVDVVAFVDSDCVPPSGWLQTLSAQLTDPLVGAAAPRVTASYGPRGAGQDDPCMCGQSPLDLGEFERRVEPGSPVSYVPTAAIVMRTSALSDPAFDEDLRYGEDVDAVWRMIDAGWDVRYVPTVHVAHSEPETRTAMLARRFRYGTSAGPLERRHHGRLAPLVVQPWPTVVTALVLTGRPLLALAAGGLAMASLVRRLAAVGVPVVAAVPMTTHAVGSTLLGIARATAQLGAPIAMVACVARPRRRMRRFATLASLVVAPHVASRVAAHPSSGRRVGMVRWVAAGIADDIAYGTGVWCGAWSARTWGPVTPRMKMNTANERRRHG